MTAGDELCELSQVPEDETRCAVLANLFVTEGKPGKVFIVCYHNYTGAFAIRFRITEFEFQVLKVHCKRRTGEDNFITSIRKVLTNEYKDKVVGKSKTCPKHLFKWYKSYFRFSNAKDWVEYSY